MARLSWPKAKAYSAGRRSRRTEQRLDRQLQDQAVSARQLAAQAYHVAAKEYQAWQQKLGADPANPLLQAVLKLKFQRRKVAYEQWAEAKRAQETNRVHERMPYPFTA